MDQLVSFRISKPVVEQFRRLCEQHGLKMGRTVERLMREELKRLKPKGKEA